MSARARFAHALLAALLTATPAAADVVLDWNEAALDSIRASNTSPPAASRNLAILHAAIYDAVNGLDRRHEPYLVAGNPPASASRPAAASAAGRDVLRALYPARAPIHDALHESVLATLPRSPQVGAGLEWGAHVAAAILEARSDDGAATAAEPAWAGGTAPGEWRPTAPGFQAGLLPGWGAVRPFGVPSIVALRPPPPPALDSAEYADEVEFVRQHGSASSSSRTEDQTATAIFWGYGAGSATPPGHWNQIAQVVAASRGLGLEENARLFALLNVAQADAAIASWDCKYAYAFWRPITAIRLADEDGNDATAADPQWTPLLPTPRFPEYTSGHSTFSGAAASVLAHVFGRDDVAFSVGSDDLAGARDYASFSEAAFESGMSRIFGGIHFMSANRNGLSIGMEIGDVVATTLLRPKENRSRK